MNAALAAFVEGPESHDFAVHHAGIATEHLLKAYLAGIHPALIVDGQHFDSLLHATGLGSHAGPLTKVKTIGLVEAYVRVVKLLPGKIPISKGDLQPLADARNGVAHSAIHDSAQSEVMFTACLRLVDPVLEELEVDPNSYWGPYLVLHDKLVDEQVRQERVAAEALLVKARSLFEQRFGHMSPKERDVVLAAITSKPMITMGREAPVECPACGSQGWMAGEVEAIHVYVDGQVTVDPEEVLLSPQGFHCAACELEVGTKLLLHLSDLPRGIFLDARPHDYIEDEPAADEGIYRGR
ncbi:hypothetical protein E5082_28620 [Streptomyces griseoluteus]|uniref:Uncharacterized protein n=2 Tax=Streptomyces griseoluteus TaxID=29306 RepID=A0A4Z1D3C9_STRGP|nr:hypothetical protein E5082_28620 [Streptomyces griseoluteus]GHE93004.1 hypothetical protein GCM10017776_06860 [Streptomyces griseoluteus]